MAADLERWLTLSVAATYAVSIGALAVEHLALWAVGERPDRRQGVVSVASGALAFGGLALAHRLLYAGILAIAWRHRAVDLGGGPAAWLAAFVLNDLMFYVAHRAGHRVRLLWCFHSVHHTSEEMRLTSAIRGSALDFVYLPWFFVWLPLVGLHPALVLIAEAWGRIWGVLVHVHPRFVGRLGVLDRLCVTPSVHRVHHGRNAEYIDRNYGEVLLLWDRLFGSYQVEEAPPEYGVLAPVDPGDLVDVQLSPWRALWRDVRAAEGARRRLALVFGPPGAKESGAD
ncbi:MAG TPA: sterol desaturase family protein [Polyangiaceae bacterium]|nr:sterol desaturase family protein [Polyangiaceae bacterium]